MYNIPEANLSERKLILHVHGLVKTSLQNRDAKGKY